MLVLGIDPGTQTTGYGILELNGKPLPNLIHCGWISTENNGYPEKRLNEIYEKTLALLTKHKPDTIAMERLFFFSNQKTAISVAQAQGVFLLAAAKNNIPIHMYTPGQVKREIAGSGRANKKLMKKTVQDLFKLEPMKKQKTYFDDVCDAIAIALCHVRLAMPRLKTNV